MRKLPKPTDENGALFVPEKVFDICISRIANTDLKSRLKAVRGQIKKASGDYDKAAASAALHTIKVHSKVGDVTKDEMVDVYEKKGMVKKGRPGRPIYERIRNSPEHQRCPLCNVGTVKTLDHHLPKSKYPKLAVTPNNLVPSCMWCQGEKKTDSPTTAGEQTIHPYYDDFETEVWLYAEVVQITPAAFRFFVKPPTAWAGTIEQRLNFHLVTFNLLFLYSMNAGSELSGIRARLARLLNAGGGQAVSKYLLEESGTWEDEFKNSWKAAMYRAAASNYWFCNGGFSV